MFMNHRAFIKAAVIAALLSALEAGSISAAAPVPAAPRTTLGYTLAMPRPSTHLYEVGFNLGSLRPEKVLDLVMPVWRPGRYTILDMPGGVRDFRACAAGGRELRWEKVDRSTWRVHADGAREVHVSYRVYADEFRLRTRGLNGEHGYVDGTAVFMYVEKLRNRPLTLEVRPYPGWHVTTGLEGSGTSFRASSYDELMDCPLEIGTQKDFDFMVDGVPHVLSISGGGDWDAGKLVNDIARIVKAEKDFWGGFPYKRYVFLLECLADPTGATEHLNSTIIQTRPFIFADPGSYRGFLGGVAHEFFHTWNIKQLRPKAMSPYDLKGEDYSRELWVAEGTTSYYTGLILERLGYEKPDEYVKGLADTVRGDLMRPGNAVQPVSEASFDSWLEAARNDEDLYNAGSNIYQRGAAVSMALDLTIRGLSADKHSLDDVMRALYSRFPLSGPGYTVEDLRRVAEEFAGAGLGKFFDDHVFGAKALPWEDLLRTAGIDLTVGDGAGKPWVGLRTGDRGDRTTVAIVIAGSPAEAAGCEAGDELLALDGFRLRSGDFNARLGGMKIGDAFTLTVFRGDRLLEIPMKAGADPVPAYTAAKVKSPTPEQKAVFESWLQATW